MSETKPSQPPTPKPGGLRRFLTFALPALVLGAAALLAVALVKTSPKAAPLPPQRSARLVETRLVKFAAQPTIIQANGIVKPAREVLIYPRVAGEVMMISPELMPGGRFAEGAMLVKIDPADFELTVRQREADLARSRATITQEMGQQAVAKREYELLGEGISEQSRALVLRQPQLAQARAAEATAEAALELARLNLERTTVKAPFNGTVRARNVNAGMQVTANTALLTLTGSDEYWVELTVPVDQLRWLRIPRAVGERGSRVRLTSESFRHGKDSREGEVLRLLPDLEPNSRLARVLVSVADPLALRPENAGQPALILGDYVRAQIEGAGLPAAVALERSVFRDGDQVWVMSPRKELEIRPVTVGYRGPETLLVTAGLTNGDQVITTDLPAAVAGMSLRTATDAPAVEAGRGPGMAQGGPGGGGRMP
ncbi:MAG: efflux RND transporter periplasmic adaptor subunit [Gemmatimonadales bacterium]|nr:MAG: efflux RND transporter periplasmic adaptor subunit [Gemmatimonadales bacterium]